MKSLVTFKNLEEGEIQMCPCSPRLQEQLKNFYNDLLQHLGHPESEGDSAEQEAQTQQEASWGHKLLALLTRKEDDKKTEDDGNRPGN